MNEPIPTQETGRSADGSAAARLARTLLAPAVAAFAVGAVLTLALTVLLHILVDRSAWHMNVPSSFRWALLAYAVMQAVILAVVVGLGTSAQVAGRRAVRLSAAALITILLFLWLTSWGLFWATGRFLDQDSLELAVASPLSMLAHVIHLAPSTIVLVPLGTAAAVLLMVAAARLVARAPVVMRSLPLGVLVVMLLAANSYNRQGQMYLSTSDLHIAHPEGGSGTRTRVRDLYEELSNERSEPIAHLRSSRRRQVLTSEMSPEVAVSWPVIEPYSAAPPERPYNVVLLVVESLRSDELEAYGSTLPVMPGVDRFARDATVFRDHYAVATHSNYSSVVPVSSQYPLRDERMHVYPETPLYPRVLLYDVLKPLGYRTSIISSQNERWGGMINFLASDQLDHLFHAETYTGEKYVPEEDGGFALYVQQYGRSGKIDDRFTIDEAIRWIGDDPQAQPFVTYINLQNSHVPYPIPGDAPTPFGPRTPSFPIRFNYFPEDSAGVVRGVYRNALHYVDAQVGRLIDHLQQTGQWENTIFVLVGDHGQAFFEHGFAAHSNELYEELLRTPLIMHAPGMDPGIRTGLAQQVDIAPTVLELLGLPPHPGFQGHSILHRSREFAYSIVQSPLSNQFGIVHGSDKLVVDARRQTAVLRDLALDPLERFDFSEREPLTALSLRERLDTWRAAQLKYYNTPLMQADTYAPVLPERPSLAGADGR